MNSQQVAQYLPIAKQALQVNALLLLYFILPNFSSFLLVALLATALLAPALLQRINCAEEQSCCDFNSCFRSYLELSGVHKLMVIVGLGVLAQLTYLLPSWVIVLAGAEVWAFWELLVSFGVVELGASAINSTESALTKFFNLIPRYQE